MTLQHAPSQPISAASRGIRPYVAVNSQRTINDVWSQINAAIYHAYGPDASQRGGTFGLIVDPLFHYERFLKAIKSSGSIRCMPIRDLVRCIPKTQYVQLGIRHDVDMDIRTAVSLAELEHRYRIQTTYYVLHTSPYYGKVDDGVFKRNECMAHVYRYIESLGHEIALHTDALHLYQDHRLDGAAAIREELEWLRSVGLTITGTTAHNSADTYGAENFAIFKGRPQRGGADPADCPTEIVHQCRWAPLQVLDEHELGLEYEANELFWQHQVPLSYGAARGSNIWRWQRNKNPFRMSSAFADDHRLYGEFEQMVHGLANLPLGEMALVVVHPEHFGLRHAPHSGPVLRLEQITCAASETLGWESYEPHSVQARAGDFAGDQEFQAIGFTNEFGMLDLPVARSPQSNHRVIILGGTNVNGSSVGPAAQMHARISGLSPAVPLTSFAVWKLAFPGMGFARLFAWYEALKRDIRPHVAVVGIGADECERSIPELWAARTGFDPAHPPGAYLQWDGKSVRVVPRSSTAALRRRNPRPTAGVLSACESVPEPHTEYLSRCLGFFLDHLKAEGIQPVLLVDECGESLGIWDAASEQATRERAITRMESWLERLLRNRRVPIVNPYRAFLAPPPGLETHWKGTREWSYWGHNLAAETLLEVLRPLFDRQKVVR